MQIRKPYEGYNEDFLLVENVSEEKISLHHLSFKSIGEDILKPIQIQMTQQKNCFQPVRNEPMGNL